MAGTGYLLYFTLFDVILALKISYFYTTRKNPINTPHKLQLKKFDPIVGKHVVFVESKMKGGKK